jgi:hypothetical protein
MLCLKEKSLIIHYSEGKYHNTFMITSYSLFNLVKDKSKGLIGTNMSKLICKSLPYHSLFVCLFFFFSN